jgi:polar amino acid transport system substrate-binding protein
MSRLAIFLASLFLLASCASAPAGPPAAARSDLAPTGKLRVAINYGNPLFARR